MAKPTIAGLQGQLESARATNNELSRRIDRLTSELNNAQSATRTAQEEVRQLKKELSDARMAVATAQGATGKTQELLMQVVDRTTTTMETIADKLS